MVHVSEITASSILVPQKIGALSDVYDFTINPYAGCAFACSYCYVPKFPNGKHASNEWGKWVQVKTNAPDLIRKERTRIFGSRIFFGSATDPYQYLELKYRLTRRCLEELLRYKPDKLTIHTRSHLILQDLELIKSFKDTVRVGVSITTNDDAIRKQFEPNAPSIPRRLDLLARLSQAGINVHVSMAPLLPCDPDKLVNLVCRHANMVWVGQMNYPEINNRPELLEKYKDFFAPAAYAATVNKVQSLFRSGQACRAHYRERARSQNTPTLPNLHLPKHLASPGLATQLRLL
jgi:DNA repair photolyase